jgi:hypothetical protein
MNERIAVGAAALMTSLAAGTHILRCWPAPVGRHRARRPLLLPDEPVSPAAPVPHAVLDEGELERLLDDGVLAANAYATCPAEQRRTFHAFYRTGVRRCWTCGKPSAGDAIGHITTTTEGD